MFSFFTLIVSLFSIFGTALHVNITAVKDAIPSSPSFSIHAVDQPLDSCGGAYLDDIVDVNSLAETILWKVGTLAVKNKEMSCKVSLAIKYNEGWAYTISDVSWRGRVVMEPDAVATVNFKGSYQGGLTAYSNAWTLRDQSGGPGGWGQPKGDFKTGSDWEVRHLIEPRDQVWSPPNQISPLNIDWKVAFASARTKGMLSVLGDTSKGGNPLALRIGLKFKKL